MAATTGVPVCYRPNVLSACHHLFLQPVNTSYLPGTQRPGIGGLRCVDCKLHGKDSACGLLCSGNKRGHTDTMILFGGMLQPSLGVLHPNLSVQPLAQQLHGEATPEAAAHHQPHKGATRRHAAGNSASQTFART